jgi:transposase
VAFADPHARLTRRFRQRIGVDCQSMPTSRAAVRHAVSWGTARRAERAFLDAWDRTRPKRRPRHLGVDEIQRGKGQHFWTVLSDLVLSKNPIDVKTGCLGGRRLLDPASQDCSAQSLHNYLPNTK